jgi:outer membrane protein
MMKKIGLITRGLLLFSVAANMSAAPDANTAADSAPAGSAFMQGQGFLRNFGQAPGIFPNFWRPYLPNSLPLPNLDNSPRLLNLIQDGKLELSLSDALALTLENNLDIAVQRYVIPFAQTDLLRTRSGQAARSFAGALSPGELNAGAIGAGVTNAGGTGGTGNAGGITGGGGAVFVGPAGAFDPTVNVFSSWDRVTSPLNSVVVSGIPTTTSYATAFGSTYSQMFTDGTSYSVSVSALRQSTTQRNTLYNPSVTSRLSIGVNQPLLNARGKLYNERFMRISQTNRKTADDVFREQVITSVAQLENAYWDLAAFKLNVQVAQESLAASQELVNQTRKQEEVGTMARLDVVTAESQAAASQRDLIVAQTNLQQQETTLKQLISKQDDPKLDSATVVLTDSLPEPRDSDLPSLEDALRTAAANRPELRVASNNLVNQDVAIRFTQNNMLPTASVFGLYASSGLQGNTALLTTGTGGSLSQSFGAVYPETAYGVTISAPLRNRSAQADNVRSMLERNQQHITLQNTRNTINVQVRQARINLIQGRSQVEAAHEAVRLAQLSLDAERQKLTVGLSTPYTVVLRQRDLATAQYAEVQALGAYAKSLVALDQATGTILDHNRIQLQDALSGNVATPPSPPLGAPALSPGGSK